MIDKVWKLNYLISLATQNNRTS